LAGSGIHGRRRHRPRTPLAAARRPGDAPGVLGLSDEV